MVRARLATPRATRLGQAFDNAQLRGGLLIRCALVSRSAARMVTGSAREPSGYGWATGDGWSPPKSKVGHMGASEYSGLTHHSSANSQYRFRRPQKLIRGFRFVPVSIPIRSRWRACTSPLCNSVESYGSDSAVRGAFPVSRPPSAAAPKHPARACCGIGCQLTRNPPVDISLKLRSVGVFTLICFRWPPREYEWRSP